MMYEAKVATRMMGEWVAASMRLSGQMPYARAFPLMGMMEATGRVWERAFTALAHRPAWRLDPVLYKKKACAVTPCVERAGPFGDLVRFVVDGRPALQRRILLVAPMSGHYATLLREQVASLLPDADVWITDWHNARDVPVGAGRFGLDAYIGYITDYLEQLGDKPLDVIAVCQPVPLVMVAAALRPHLVASLTVMGGPVDPYAAPTRVTDFGSWASMGQLRGVLERVGGGFAGDGRLVYPGSTQLASFIGMNPDRHGKAFWDRIGALSRNPDLQDDGFDRFYPESRLKPLTSVRGCKATGG